MSNTESSNAPQKADRVGDLMANARIADYINRYDGQARRDFRRWVERAAEWLVGEHSREDDLMLLMTLEHLLPPLEVGKVDVFFSYKMRIQSNLRGQLELVSWEAVPQVVLYK